MTDLFEQYDKQPAELQKLCAVLTEKMESGNFYYSDTREILKEFQKIGFIFSYGLDNELYSLRPYTKPQYKRFDLNFELIIKYAEAHDLNYECYSPIFDRGNCRYNTIDSWIGIELKPHIYYWWKYYVNPYETAEQNSKDLFFDSRYNRNNGATRKSYKTQHNAEQIILNFLNMRKIEDLKNGEYFKRKPTSKEIYQKGNYNRSAKKYSCTAESDFCKEIFIAKGKEVFTDFDY